MDILTRLTTDFLQMPLTEIDTKNSTNALAEVTLLCFFIALLKTSYNIARRLLLGQWKLDRLHCLLRLRHLERPEKKKLKAEN
jgi:hypothetical protein